MIFIHSVKSFFNNFALCYKTLLYKVIALVLSLAIVATFMYTPIVNLYNIGGLDSTIQLFKVTSISEFFAGSKNAMESLFYKFNLLSVVDRTSIIVGIVVFVLLFGFLFNLDKIPKAEIISSKMSSNLRLGYTGQFFRKIGYSSLFSLLNLLYFIICCAIIGLIYVGLLNLLYLNAQIAAFAPFLIFIILLLLISFALTIFGTHPACAVLNECGPFKALIIAIQKNFKEFLKTFSLNLGFFVLAVLINVFAAFISAGALLILTLPCTIVFYNTLSATICYNEHGNRYYVDPHTVYTPKQNENFDKVKNIIDLI